jgi:hypothetical protein
MFWIASILVGWCLRGVSKALADITSHDHLWSTSIFSNRSEVSWWGPNNKTHTRKGRSFFTRWIFVAFADIWHTANLIQRLSIMWIIISTIMMVRFSGGDILTELLWESGGLVIDLIFFPVFFHFVLRKKGHRGIHLFVTRTSRTLHDEKGDGTKGREIT